MQTPTGATAGASSPGRHSPPPQGREALAVPGRDALGRTVAIPPGAAPTQASEAVPAGLPARAELTDPQAPGGERERQEADADTFKPTRAMTAAAVSGTLHIPARPRAAVATDASARGAALAALTEAARAPQTKRKRDDLDALPAADSKRMTAMPELPSALTVQADVQLTHDDSHDAPSLGNLTEPLEPAAPAAPAAISAALAEAADAVIAGQLPFFAFIDRCLVSGDMRGVRLASRALSTRLLTAAGPAGADAVRLQAWNAWVDKAVSSTGNHQLLTHVMRGLLEAHGQHVPADDLRNRRELLQLIAGDAPGPAQAGLAPEQAALNGLKGHAMLMVGEASARTRQELAVPAMLARIFPAPSLLDVDPDMAAELDADSATILECLAAAMRGPELPEATKRSVLQSLLKKEMDSLRREAMFATVCTAWQEPLAEGGEPVLSDDRYRLMVASLMSHPGLNVIQRSWPLETIAMHRAGSSEAQLRDLVAVAERLDHGERQMLVRVLIAIADDSDARVMFERNNLLAVILGSWPVDPGPAQLSPTLCCELGYYYGRFVPEAAARAHLLSSAGLEPIAAERFAAVRSGLSLSRLGGWREAWGQPGVSWHERLKTLDILERIGQAQPLRHSLVMRLIRPVVEQSGSPRLLRHLLRDVTPFTLHACLRAVKDAASQAEDARKASFKTPLELEHAESLDIELVKDEDHALVRKQQIRHQLAGHFSLIMDAILHPRADMSPQRRRQTQVAYLEAARDFFAGELAQVRAEAGDTRHAALLVGGGPGPGPSSSMLKDGMLFALEGLHAQVVRELAAAQAGAQPEDAASSSSSSSSSAGR